MESLPEKLRPAKTDLAQLEAMLEIERAKLAETEAWHREQEALIAAEDEGIKAAKAKLQAAKTAKDFAAANREIDNKRRSRAEREEEVLKVIDAMEATRASLTEHEADVDSLRAKVTAEEAAIAEKVAELEVKMKEAAAGRDEVAGKIDAELLDKYEQVLKRRDIAVVPVVDGTCQGCHMRIPPQLNNVLARFESIESCPACVRLLYRSELIEDE
jgi:predicted  nucleic acid-binding Zn-ribbon protein